MKAKVSWVFSEVDEPAEAGRYLVVVEMKDLDGEISTTPYQVDTADFQKECGWEPPDFFDVEANVIAWAALPEIPEEAWTTRGQAVPNVGVENK